MRYQTEFPYVEACEVKKGDRLIYGGAIVGPPVEIVATDEGEYVDFGTETAWLHDSEGQKWTMPAWLLVQVERRA
jgi:hypothetical protein